MAPNSQLIYVMHFCIHFLYSKMGMLGCVLSFFLGINANRSNYAYEYKTVELKVPMDCEGCESKVRNVVSAIKGVSLVEVNRIEQRVRVTGCVDRKKTLKKVRAGIGKSVEFWPYVPYNVVYHPYTPDVYDEEAPAGHVRNADYRHFSDSNRIGEKYCVLFSDENAHACIVM